MNTNFIAFNGNYSTKIIYFHLKLQRPFQNKRVYAKNNNHLKDDFKSLFISIINKGNKRNNIHQGSQISTNFNT